MTLEEYLNERANLFVQDLWENYNVQQDKNGNKYIIDPFPTKEEYLERFSCDLEEILDDDVDVEEIGNLSEQIENELATIVANAYDKVLNRRMKFLESTQK